MIAFEIMVTAIQSGGSVGTTGDGWATKYTGAVKNISGTTSLIGSVTEESIAGDAGTTAWDASVTADDGNDAVVIFGTSTENRNIEWVAKAKLTRNSI